MLNDTAGWSRQAPAYTLMFVVGAACARALPTFSGLPSFTNLDLTRLASAQQAISGQHIVVALGLATVAIVAYVGVLNRAKFAGLSAPGPLTKLIGFPRQGDPKPPASDTKDVDTVRDGLEKQLSDLVKTVSRYLESTNSQSAAYEKVRTSLKTASTVEQIQAIVEVLVTSSAQGQQDAEDLRSSLKDAQTQTMALRQRLVKAEKLASHDPLTALPNRRHFQEFLESAVSESHAAYTPLSIVMADIDNFKKINDRFGHQTGDAVLRQFAEIMAKSVRATDMVARYGGEEFALVLKSTPMGNALQVAERIRANILAATWKDAKAESDIGQITASFGIAEIIDGETAERVVGRADQKLYAAKKNGRNRVEIDTSHR